jgi:hypothetical protein
MSAFLYDQTDVGEAVREVAPMKRANIMIALAQVISKEVNEETPYKYRKNIKR